MATERGARTTGAAERADRKPETAPPRRSARRTGSRAAAGSLTAPPARSARGRARAGDAGEKPAKPRGREKELLEVAAAIFSQRGYADSTVQDVADALGILKGSLYYYIDTKEDLLYRLLDQVHNEVDELLAEMRKLSELPALEQLEAYVRRQTEYNVRNLEKITIYYHDLESLSGERRKHIAARRRAHDDYVVALIEQAQAEGAADRSLDPRLLSNCVFATIIWTYRWYRPRAGYKAEDAIDICTRFALGGIIGRPPGEAAKRPAAPKPAAAPKRAAAAKPAADTKRAAAAKTRPGAKRV